MTLNDEHDDVQFTLRLPHPLHAEITRRANEVDRSLNWYIRNALSVAVEGLGNRDAQYPDPLPDRTDGACGHQYSATFQFAMPLFEFPEDHDDTAPSEGRVGTERRIESALAECAHVLRRWGCVDQIVVHSIHDIGGSRLPSRITNHPEGTTTIGNEATGGMEYAR